MNEGEESVLRVLFVGNDADLARELEDAAARMRGIWINLEREDSCIAGFESLKSGAYDICLAAEPLHDVSAADFIRRATADGCRTPILYVSRDGELQGIADAMKAGASDYLVRGEIGVPPLERSFRHAIERRRLEEEIETLLTAAGESARAKSQFMSTITHEFKTPLNSIIGLIDLVLDSDLTHEQHENLMFARFSADSLLTLMTNIIECSSLQAGQISLNNRFFRIRQLLAKILLPLNLAAERKSLPMSSHIGPGIPELLFGDPDRLSQVVVHLLDNAIKFTDNGSVALSVTVNEVRGANLTLHWVVSDTGAGIPAERIDSIFHPFTQVDGSTSRRHGGAGIGLSVVRNLVTLLGGKIWVESENGKGTRIHFTTRLSSGQGREEQPGGRDLRGGANGRGLQPMRNGRILAADDSLVNQMVLTDMLQKAGYGVMIVDNGLKAVEATERERFVAVLLDLQMPVMDGYDAARFIREREASGGGRLPIIALTGSDDPRDRERCREAGFDGYVTKPLRENDLMSFLKKHASPFNDESSPSSYGEPGFEDRCIGQLYNALGGDSKVVSEVLAYFLQEGAAQLCNIRCGLAARDEKLIEQSAHKLKGMAANVGATCMTDDIFRIQLAIRKGDFETPKDVVDRLEKMMAAMPDGSGGKGNDTPC